MSAIERTIQVNFQHRVHFTHDVFLAENLTLKNILTSDREGQLRKALVIVDESLALAQPTLARAIENYFATHSDCLKLVCPPVIIEGGERAKNSYFHVSEIHSDVEKYHIDRHSYIIAI